jgi:predicted esterase
VIDSAAVIRTAGDAASESRGTPVLLHGYGSDEREVFDRVVRVLPERSIASLRGPVREGEGFGWVSLERSLRDLGADELLGMADRVAAAVLDWLALHSTADRRIYDIGHAQSDEEYDDVAAFVRSMPQR